METRERDTELRALLRPEEVEALDQMIGAEVPELMEMSERHMMYCLFGRKLDVERGITLAKNFLAFSAKYEFDKPRLEMIERIVDSRVFQTDLSLKDAQGRFVSYIWASRMLSEEAQGIFGEEAKVPMMQLSWKLLEQAYEHDINFAREGCVYVEDLGGISFGEMMRMMGKDDMSERMSAQDNIPMRFRAIYIVNAPLWIRVIMAMMAPFMKAKLRSKIFKITAPELAPLLGGEDKVHVSLGGTWQPDDAALKRRIMSGFKN